MNSLIKNCKKRNNNCNYMCSKRKRKMKEYFRMYRIKEKKKKRKN